jgi:hypothetical protein
MDFYISDFAADPGGFVVSDLDELIGRGSIEVVESGAVEGEATPERAPRPSEPRTTAAPGGDGEVVARTLTNDPVALSEALGPADAGGPPALPGFYASWAAEGAIRGLPHHPHPRRRGLGLFYVGISPPYGPRSTPENGTAPHLAHPVMRHQPAHMSRDPDVDDSRCAPPPTQTPQQPRRIDAARLTAHTPYECSRIHPERPAKEWSWLSSAS